MRPLLISLLCLVVAVPASAQLRPAPQEAQDDQQQPPPPPQQTQIRRDQAGRTADSAVGEVGKRQTREQATGIQPMARISNRIQNRVQNRIRNRIDPGYDPQANAASPFENAEEQARSAGRPRR